MMYATEWKNALQNAEKALTAKDKDKAIIWIQIAREYREGAVATVLHRMREAAA